MWDNIGKTKLWDKTKCTDKPKPHKTGKTSTKTRTPSESRYADKSSKYSKTGQALISTSESTIDNNNYSKATSWQISPNVK